MNDTLDRADILAALRPQSARENERALTFALQLTPGTPALDAVRGRGVMAPMIAEQRARLADETRARESQGGFSRPSGRPAAAPRSGRVSAEGSIPLPARFREFSIRPNDAGSRISASVGQSDRHRSPAVARASAMSPSQAVLLGNSIGGSPRDRLRTVDGPAAAYRQGFTEASQVSRGSQPRVTPTARRVNQGYVTSGSLALSDPGPVPQANTNTRQTSTPNIRPSLRVLSGGKTVGKTRKKILGGLAIIALVTIAFAAVFMHAGLARTQLGIDKLNIEITQAERMNQRLRVQVATLEAPDRIVSVAQELGLEPPKTVRFLPTAAPMALAATRIVR